MTRYELTEVQRKRCLEIWNCLKSLGVEAGTPERGKKWWNWPNCKEYRGPIYNAVTHEEIEPRKCAGLSAGGFMLKFWVAIMKALFEHDYPCTLNHAIRYYVLTPGLNDWEMSEEERNKRILYNLYKHPEYV